MEVVKIENHINRALARRLQQWIEKPNLKSLIEVHAGGYQDLEQVFIDLRDATIAVANAFGAQLDVLGQIVGQERMNFDDDFYRILLLARIGINVSNGEPERIISTTKLLTKANFVHYMSLRGAEIAVGSDGVINPLSVSFLLSNLGRVVMGGVRVDYLAIYDGPDSFSFDGPNQKTPGKGFGSIDDANAGGKFGQVHTYKTRFSFAGNNTSDNGFGSIYDPLVGGVL